MPRVPKLSAPTREPSVSPPEHLRRDRDRCRCGSLSLSLSSRPSSSSNSPLSAPTRELRTSNAFTAIRRNPPSPQSVCGRERMEDGTTMGVHRRRHGRKSAWSQAKCREPEFEITAASGRIHAAPRQTLCPRSRSIHVIGAPPLPGGGSRFRQAKSRANHESGAPNHEINHDFWRAAPTLCPRARRLCLLPLPCLHALGARAWRSSCRPSSSAPDDDDDDDDGRPSSSRPPFSPARRPIAVKADCGGLR
ncbi:hypothetical protein BKA93DRAFT_824832 [Sparassis latifolia]